MRGIDRPLPVDDAILSCQDRDWHQGTADTDTMEQEKQLALRAEGPAETEESSGNQVNSANSQLTGLGTTPFS